MRAAERFRSAEGVSMISISPMPVSGSSERARRAATSTYVRITRSNPILTGSDALCPGIRNGARAFCLSST